MVGTTAMDEWHGGGDYEAFMGRWSRLVAPGFLEWLAPAPGLGWLDVGSGTGALSAVVVDVAQPREVVGIDTTADMAARAARRVADPRVSFAVLDAQELAFDREFDVVVSGLLLTFLSPVEWVIGAMREAVRPGGVVAAYIWDYAGHMEFLDHYWKAAAEVDVAASERDEAVRFATWTTDRLATLWHEAGLGHVETSSLDVELRLDSFDDYWRAFVVGQGPAPSHLASLEDHRRVELEGRLRARLPTASDGSITLGATALAVKGVR